jgi:glycosyltransferase involved in cell wall biosynthesis
VGDDIHRTGYRIELERQSSEFGLDRQVKFLGHRSDVPELLQQLDMVVCSSHQEPFGICLIEAMATGLPVVGTSVGGIPEVIADGVCGYIVPPRSSADLASAVKRLVLDAALRDSMGRAGRERVLSLFSPAMQAQKVTAIYESLLISRRKGGTDPTQ